MKKAPVKALTGVLLTDDIIPLDDDFVQTDLRSLRQTSNGDKDVHHSGFRRVNWDVSKVVRFAHSVHWRATTQNTWSNITPYF
jgi:hypothetical protein